MTRFPRPGPPEVGPWKASAGAGHESLHPCSPISETGIPLVSGTELVQRAGRREHRASPDNLADIGGDEVADKLLHVAVDGPALLHSSHNGGKVVI